MLQAAHRRLLLLSLMSLTMAPGCGPPSMDMRPTPIERPERIADGVDLHLLALWTTDTVVYGEAAQVPPPQGRTPWPALYRAKVGGSERELLARQVFNLLIRRARAAQDPAPLLVYQTPTKDGTQNLRSTGRLHVCRPGEAPREITPADPPLVLQPALLSPDSRYLLSYGLSQPPFEDFFALDLTDLQTGTSRRLGLALSITPPRWLGFAAGQRRYVAFRNVEGYRPVALYDIEAGGPPLPFESPVVGLLPDGRGVLEGQDLPAAVLSRGGALTPLYKGPVLEYSAFVSGPAAYFISAPPGDIGALIRVAPGEDPRELHPLAGYFWYAPPGGTVAYFADDPEVRNMRAARLPRGPVTLLHRGQVTAYKPGLGDAVFYFRAQGGVGYFDPAQSAPQLLSDKASAVWQISARQAALLEDRSATGGAPRSLRLIDLAAPKDGEPLAVGVDLADGGERPDGTAILAYSVPEGDGDPGRVGIWRVFLPRAESPQ
jgi:hypothetical protein